MIKIMKEPKELNGYLSTPSIEVTKLVFASDDVVWIAWRYGAEEELSSLRHTNEVIGAFATAGLGYICIVTLTGWNKLNVM